MGSRRIAARVTPGAICLSSSSHFPPRLYSKFMNPVALPPGRARLSTKPAATGSTATGNTIGTVRVTCSTGPTVEVPWARMTSGASAASSAACLRISTALVVPSGCRCARCGRWSSPIVPAPAGTPRRGPEIPHRPRLRAKSRRRGARARPVAHPPRAAMTPPRRREHREIPFASCPPLGSGDGIVTAQTSTLIGANPALAQAADVRCGSICDMAGHLGHVRFAPESRRAADTGMSVQAKSDTCEGRTKREALRQSNLHSDDQLVRRMSLCAAGTRTARKS